MASTHFEPTDARSAFPCLDEPFFKAIFHISITHNNNLTAMSNMPVEESKMLLQDSSRNITVFLPTLKMSTYLVAMTVHDYTWKEEFTKSGVKVRYNHLFICTLYTIGAFVKWIPGRNL